jgi:membrane-associated phospholipid phosphatase
MKVIESVELRWWIAALLFFVAFAILGSYVSSRVPGRLDVQALELRGEALPLAAFFTLLGFWYVVSLLSLAALAFAFAVRADVKIVAAIVGSQLASQAIVMVLKAVFHRPRPDNLLIFKEPDTSFPSGHSVTAIVFYLALAFVLARSDVLPRPLAPALAAVLALCVAGLPWSRLSLGAHYLSDVCGGLLFGAGWLCVMVALAYRFGYVLRFG